MTSSTSPIRKLLVANGGEIAIRVFRAADEFGSETVAVYTWEHCQSLHRLKADEAYQIGEEGRPLEPYLDIEAIIGAAQSVEADAIHLGYGFLSEYPALAEGCESAGITFVGPPPRSSRWSRPSALGSTSVPSLRGRSATRETSRRACREVR